MSDNLTIFGEAYTGVVGIKTKGTGNGTLTYIRPQGTKSISSNGTGIDVTEYAAVNVAVPSSGDVDMPTITVVFDNNWETIQSVSFDKTYQECNTYINNDIWYALVNVSTQSGTEGYSAFANLMVSGSYLLYAVTGGLAPVFDVRYNPDGTTAAINPSSRLEVLNITTNGTYYPTHGSTSYINEVNVAVSGSPSLQAKTNINPTTSSQTIGPDAGYDGLSSVQINAMPSGSATTPATTVTANPSISVGSDGLITASVSATKSVTPTVSAGYVSSGTAGTVTVSGSATEQLTLRSSTDLTASGAIVTAPAGYYAENATKAVSSMTLPTSAGSSATSGYTSKATISPSTSDQYINIPTGYNSAGAYYKINAMSTMTLPTSAAASATSGYTSKATIDRSTSDQYINIPTGYNDAGAYYKISAVANGSATGPSSLSGSSATVSTGTNTITLTKTGVTTTPTVSAGYVSSATASTATVTLTASVTTKAAATITPGTTNQTIASGTYLTGTQTISGDSNLVASNILSGKSIFGVAGSVSFINVYTSSSAPSSSTGSNGDIYIKTVS